MKYPDNEACVCCCHVERAGVPGLPVLYVQHDEDGFLFACSPELHRNEELHVFALHRVLSPDPSLARLIDVLPLDRQAHRQTAGADWVIEGLKDAA